MARGTPAETPSDAPPGPTPELLVLCTGNAARSVMAGSMLDYLTELSGLPLRVATAGTHAIDGLPVSRRTRTALTAIDELADAPVSRHRSRQVVADDLRRATLVVAMEAAHVRYVRRFHPEGADRTATLRRLCRDLPPGPGRLADRVTALDLAGVPLSKDEDVEDPAGLDDDAYVACAVELWGLCRELAGRL